MAEGASLTVLGGPLAGRRLDIDDAVDEVLVGSDPDCRLSLDLPGVSPIHARVWRDLGGITVYDTHSPRGLYVNDVKVTNQAALHDGDVLWLGAPGEADSVMLQCRLPEEAILGAPVGEPAPAADAPGTDPLADLAVEVPEAPRGEAAPSADDLIDGLAAGSAAGATDAAPPAFEVPDFEPPADVPDFEPPPPEPAAFEPPPAEPPPPAPPPGAAPDEEFVTDPAWAEDETPPAASLRPVEIDSLVDEAPAPIAAATRVPTEESARPVEPAPPPPELELEREAPPATEPEPVEPIELLPAWETPAAPPPAAPTFAPAPAAPPAPSAPAARPAPAPAPAAAVFAAATPAIIDDTHAVPAEGRPETRKPRTVRQAGPPEGVMDWARGTPAAAGDVAPPPLRPRAGGTARARGRGRGPLLLLPIAAVAVVLAAGAGYYLWSLSRTPVIEAVSPARVRVGDTITLTGTHLGDTVADAAVTIAGRPARVEQASRTRLQVVVPEVATSAGGDTAAPVVVTAGGRASAPASVAVFQAPRLAAVVPEVALPGDVVVLTGTSWGPGVKVRFAGLDAEVLEAAEGSLKVRVPPLQAALGTEVPVVATMGADPSNPLEFVLGRIPLVTGIDVRSADPGDVVVIAGRGFAAPAAANRVTVGGVPALVLSAAPRELRVVVPRAAEGDVPVEVSVPGSASIGQLPLAVGAFPDPVEFRFVAEPFQDAPGHDHAALATALGPAFILSSDAGKTAAERAYDAQVKLNDAAQALRASREADIRALFEPAPVLYLYGRNSHLLEVTAADARGYEEDWTKSRVKGGPVTPPRLAAWWEAVARDLVLLLIRGEKPQHAAALAAEGKALADLYDAGRGRVPAALVGEDRKAAREALRIVALRVPATVSGPAVAAPPDDAGVGAAPPAAGDATPALRLDGAWAGSETEGGIHKSITITFRGGSGTLTYQRALTMSVPVLAVGQPQKGAVRFEVPTGGGRRYYRGRWNGAKITGTLSSDPEGRRDVGTFELEPQG